LKAQSFTGTLSGLASGTKYYYEVAYYDSKNQSYTYGNPLSFTTPTPVTTLSPVSGITSSGAAVNWTLNPEGSPGQVQVIAGTNAENLSWFNNGFSTGEDTVAANLKAQSFTGTLSGLASGTKYYYEVAYYDSRNNGYTYGSPQSFTTASH
jgi:uncharacterized protein YfiM (DUF2279 family)